MTNVPTCIIFERIIIKQGRTGRTEKMPFFNAVLFQKVQRFLTFLATSLIDKFMFGFFLVNFT